MRRRRVAVAKRWFTGTKQRSRGVAVRESRKFELVTEYSPEGDQPTAIKQMVEGLQRGERYQTLLGATGTGKTFAIANTVAQVNKPTLVMAPNKTLAAQLYAEFKELFPHNAVEYFVSYYDYYQPEAYIPSTDTFIEKDSAINDAIDRMRHSATRSLFERNDVLIVASVSCIYGLGSGEAYMGMLLFLEEGDEVRRDSVLEKLVEMQFKRRDMDFHRGTFRVRGDVVEIFPAHEEDKAIRIEFFGDEVEAIYEIDPLRGKRLRQLEKIAVYPNTHYAVLPEKKKLAMESIKAELRERLEELVARGMLLEAQRLEQRTQFDLEMIATMGFCNGIENYSRHFSGRDPGAAPPCLFDYFPDDYLLVIDESHVTVPQIGGMYRGDRSRKTTLVEHGFRLPSAMDNRPMKFEEWENHINQVIFVSATPGDYELEKCEGVVVEQIIRPTGLIDPEIEIRPALEQVDDVYGEIRQRVDAGERVLVTTLTKRMSEDLTEYLEELGVKVRYLHSDIDTIERMNLIRDLRKGVFDVLIGINLLREGLDIPEVSLVAILDADKEGFLRSTRSLIQTIGRAARNSKGKVILYADTLTRSIKEAVEETNRRREIQLAYNEAHGITPRTITKKISDLEQHVPPDPDAAPDASPYEKAAALLDDTSGVLSPGAEETPQLLEKRIEKLREAMKVAARELRFEDAARLRDELRAVQARFLGVG
ncbi:excinuclease ABC subunit UvrB [Lujinxingia vulgaris]|uniref:UvrABC system protein B n=1 Tax=Lujinxingia vulgaris TaxID=2600176 RepID=A0A5C6XAX6_9DELT|nr:excinuclease ABC subunit UvrB [Lujinxingia vulgaris]